jgi:hypothetical protein
VKFSSACRTIAAQPGAGAKNWLRKSGKHVRFRLPRYAVLGGTSLRLCERRGEVQFGLPHDSCPTGGWREEPAGFDGGMYLRCTSPAPKPCGVGLRLRAKRNQRQAKLATNFVVKCKLATRSSAAQPGAGAKNRQRKSGKHVRSRLPRYAVLGGTSLRLCEGRGEAS